jgi:hypothetical protein
MVSQTLIDVRLTVAQALQTLPCDQECATNLLSSLNDIDQGKQNVEDPGTLEAPPGLREIVKAKIGTEQEQIYRQIRSDLLRDPKTTNIVLENVYGLGSDHPSAFAIDFVMQTPDTHACPLLKRSALALDDCAIGPPCVARDDLHRALMSLHCDK